MDYINNGWRVDKADCANKGEEGETFNWQLEQCADSKNYVHSNILQCARHTSLPLPPPQSPELWQNDRHDELLNNPSKFIPSTLPSKFSLCITWRAAMSYWCHRRPRRSHGGCGQRTVPQSYSRTLYGVCVMWVWYMYSVSATWVRRIHHVHTCIWMHIGK